MTQLFTVHCCSSRETFCEERLKSLTKTSMSQIAAGPKRLHTEVFLLPSPNRPAANQARVRRVKLLRTINLWHGRTQRVAQDPQHVRTRSNLKIMQKK